MFLIVNETERGKTKRKEEKRKRQREKRLDSMNYLATGGSLVYKVCLAEV